MPNRTLYSDSINPSVGSADDPALPVATTIDARPAALVNGTQINWGDMRPLLNEAVGADVLEEIIVDMVLQRQLDANHKIITEDDVQRERDLLLRSLNDDPNVAQRLLDELRARRGLGTQRFHNLLHRNAALRALVGDHVEVTDQQVQRLYDIRFGPKRQARLMILPDLAMAQEAIRRVQSGRSFADVAVELSTDSSASRGGLLEPISRHDPAYPAALRSELWSMDVGQVSTPILLDDQYAVVQFMRTLTAQDVPLDAVRDRLEQAARLEQQRLLMDQFVDRIMNDVSVVIFDESLRESWKQRKAVRP